MKWKQKQSNKKTKKISCKQKNNNKKKTKKQRRLKKRGNEEEKMNERELQKLQIRKYSLYNRMKTTLN